MGKSSRHHRHESLPSIGIISDERFPFQGTNTQQLLKNACALAAQGLEIEVIVPVQFRALFGKLSVFMADIKRFYNLSYPVKVKRLFGFPAGKLRFEKLFHGLIAPFYLLGKGFQIAYTRNRLPLILSLILGRKVIFETYRCLSHVQPFFARLLIIISKFKNFLGVISHSRLAAYSLINLGVPKNKVKVMYNGFDPQDMQPVLSKQEARAKLDLNDRQKLAVYAGNIGASKGIESVMIMAGKAAQVIFIVIGGHFKRQQELQREAKLKEIHNIRFLGNKPISQVSTYLYAADFLLIPPSSAPLQQFGKTVLPFKTYTYLAAGRPIIAPNLPDLAEILNHGENAWLVPADQPVQAAKELIKVMQNRQLADRLAHQALVTASRFTWEKRAKKIKAWIKEIYDKH